MNAARTSSNESQQIKLHAYQKLVKFGAHPNAVDGDTTAAPVDNSNISTTIDDCWKELGKMDPVTAKREFLILLFSLAPYWKYEQFLN